VDNRFTPLEGDEVLSVDESVQILIGHRTFRVSELTNALRQQLIQHGIGGITSETEAWFDTQGVYCEALRFGANRWHKGRVRISVEFCPDESGGGSPPPAPSAPSTMAIAPEAADPFVEDGLGEEEDLLLGAPETPAPSAIEDDDDDFFASEAEAEDELDLADASEPDSLTAELPEAEEEELAIEATETAEPEFAEDIDDIFEDAPVDLSADDNLPEAEVMPSAEAAAEEEFDLFPDEDFLFEEESDSPTPDAELPENPAADADDLFAADEDTDAEDDPFADSPSELPQMPAAEGEEPLGFEGFDIFDEAEEEEVKPAGSPTVVQGDVMDMDLDNLFDDGSDEKGELELEGSEAAADEAGEAGEDDLFDWGEDEELSLGDADAAPDDDEETGSGLIEDIWQDI
jgi:hypothetical protein